MSTYRLQSLVKTVVSLASITFLLSCGGSNTTNSENQSSSGFFESSVSSDIPALTLTALDQVPTLDFSETSTTTASTNLETKKISSLSGNLNSESVVGFIVKYKEEPSAPEAKKITGTNTRNNNSIMLTSGMSVGMASVASKNNLQLSFQSDRFDASKLYKLGANLTITQATTFAQDLKNSDPNIEYVELNKIRRHTMVPTDPYYTSYLWNLKDAYFNGVKAESAWNTSSGAGVVVAVVDTGYRPHVDMVGQILPGYDFISDASVSYDHPLPHTSANDRDDNATDPGDWVQAGGCGGGIPYKDTPSSWHGSHVAGTIAAIANNSKGIVGLAYKAKILPVRVLGTCGGYDSDIIDGIVWAAGGSVPGVTNNPNPAKIINLSLGGPEASCPSAYQQAIDTARNLGAVVVVAAGNSNINAAGFTPANCEGVITVGATTSNGTRASFSNFGSVVDLSAPGVGIVSTVNASSWNPGIDNAYVSYNGTSMATPHVSAALALMLSVNPRMTALQAETYIKKSVRVFAPSACTVTGGCGTGILKANRGLATFTGARAQGDFDDNGKSEIVYKRGITTFNRTFIGKVNQTSATSATITKAMGFDSSNISRITSAIGDFNGDRRSDLLETSSVHGKIIRIMYTNGSIVSQMVAPLGTQPLGSFVIGTADFNRDGRDEILLRGTNGDFLVASVGLDTATLTYSLITNIPNSYAYAGTGDIDGSGNMKVFWQDVAGNSLKITTIDITLAPVSTTTSTLGNFNIQGIGRFFDKTKDGILVSNSAGGLSVITTVTSGVLGAATALKDTNTQNVVLDTDFYIAGIGDYNGNGYDDIIWRKTNANNFGIFSLANSVVSRVSLPGFDPSLVIQAKR